MTKTGILTIDGKRYAVIPLDEWPPLPPADAEGFRPAKEAMAAVMARTLIRRRVELGLAQNQLGEAGRLLRVETISRLESGKHKPRREPCSASKPRSIARRSRSGENGRHKLPG